MNINMGHMANGNTSININVHPNIHSAQPTVTVNGSQQTNQALTILRSLASGATFSANITDVNGEQVTITLDGGQSFTATLLNSSAYNIGDRASFILQDNTGDSIVLKAMTMQETAFETAMVNRSLNAAGIAPTIRNREMVLELMHNGMPIGRDALLDMVKEISLHQDADISDIIALKRMGIEITDENLSAYRNYKEYNGAMQADILELGEKLSASVNTGKDLSDIVKLVADDILHALDGSESKDVNGKISYDADGNNADGKNANGINSNDKNIDGNGFSVDKTQPESTADAVQKKMMDDVRNTLGKLVDNYNVLTGRNIKLPGGIVQSDKLADFLNDLAKLTCELENEPLLRDKMHSLLKGDKVSKLLNELVRDSFSMKMTDTADSEAVKEHIAKTLGRLNSISEYAASNQNTALANSASQMNNNMEFLNNMNQFMAAIQVPIKNIGEHGDGELYVYRRNRGKDSDDDTVKAFLHLDMEHLGALDIYVTLKGSSVSTNFKVEDENVLDFLEANMEQLTKKLNDDGYNVSVNISEKEDGTGFDFTREVLAPALPVNDVKRFRFDMKA